MDATPTIQVKSYTIQEFPLKELGVSAPVAPYQLPRNHNEVTFEVNRKAYATDAFVQNDIATVTVLGTLRGLKYAQVEINPVNYNPVRGLVRQYSNIDVEVQYNAATSEITVPAHLQSPYFDVIHKVLSNSDDVTTRTAGDDYPEHPDLTRYPVRMLIITDRMFENTLKPYVEWKTQKGFDVEVAYTDNIGYSASSIRTHIKSRYDNSASEGRAAPSFVVIAGDIPQVPASKMYGMVANNPDFWSDYMYGQMDKDVYEYFPEMYYGRLSAETTNELKAIINKIIYYEKYQFADPSYLGCATAISGIDPSGLHNTYCRPTINYLAANYLTAENGYTTANVYGVNNENYSGCYDSERLSVGLVAYTAHADDYRWDNPRLDKAVLNAANNENKYPVVIANCCLSGNFGLTDSWGDPRVCIGEEWLRKEKGGAVTYIGSTPVTTWQGDCTWAMGAKSSGEWTPKNTTLGAYDAPFISDYVSTGGMMMVGNLAVTQWAETISLQYWTGYNILGDPSLVPFLGEASPISASYSKTIPVGATSFTVEAPQRSLVALSSNGNKLLASGLVGAEGSVTLTFDAITESDKVMLVITKPQHQPVITNLTFGSNAINEINTSSAPTQIEVFNLQGVLIRTITDGLPQHEQATDNLVPGAYIVVSTGETGRTIEKVIVR